VDDDFREEDLRQESSKNKAENLQEILDERLDIQEDQDTWKESLVREFSLFYT